MSLKTKLTSLITTFVLLCSLLTVGVFAVKNTTFNVGGDIVFNVQGIEADIELTANGVQNAVLADNAVAGTNVMNKIEIRNNTSAESVAEKFAKWSNLDMTFAEGQSTATIELKITNRATEEDNYIDITALADAATKENARIKVANNAGGITALLKSGEDATFTITFEVKDDEYKASLEGFSVNFDMQKKVLADFPSYDADETLIFECDTSAKTASAGGNINELNTEIEIPKYLQKDNVVCAVTSIPDWGFAESYGLASVIIPNSVTSIEERAFQNCETLTNITIPDSVTSIGDGAFLNCNSLTSIKIPSSVTSIGDFAFASCSSLTSIIIPEGVTSIGYEAFYGCTGLTSITISNSVTSIGDYAFFECTGLTNITIPDSVTSIGRSAFEVCIKLSSITIPTSVTSIGDDAFSECASLETVYYTGTQDQWNTLLENVGENNDCLINAPTINFNYTGV